MVVLWTDWCVYGLVLLMLWLIIAIIRSSEMRADCRQFFKRAWKNLA